MPVDLNEQSASAPEYTFDMAALVNTYQGAFKQVRLRYPVSGIPFDFPEQMLLSLEKKALKKSKKAYPKEVVAALEKMLGEGQKKELSALSQMLAELRLCVNFEQEVLFTPEHPILASYQFPYKILIRESKHHVGEWRVEILNEKLGEGAVGAVYGSQWVLKVRPQKLVVVKPVIDAIYDIKNSNKVVKMINPAAVAMLHSDPSAIFKSSGKIDDELIFAQHFTEKGQRYLHLHDEQEKIYYYLILQRAAGKPLDFDLFAAEENKLTYSSAVFLAYQLLSSAVNIHKKGFVHADIKPENILVETSRNLQAALIDFSGCVPIGFHETCNFGSPIIVLPEIIQSNRKSPYMVDVKTDSPSLAAALGILFGGTPFQKRKAEQDLCQADRVTSIFALQRIAPIPYDFSNLFSLLKDGPTQEKQKVLKDMLEKMSKPVREERMAAEEAMHILEGLHPELGIAVWNELKKSFDHLLRKIKDEPKSGQAFDLFQPLFLKLCRFVSRKKEQMNTEDPIMCYQYFMGELISAVDVICDHMKMQSPLASMQWCKILLDHFHQPQLVSFFNAQPFLSFRIGAIIQATMTTKKAMDLNPKDIFLHNMISLVDQELKARETPTINIVKFLEDYYHSRQFTIKNFFSIFYLSNFDFKRVCLIALINNTSLDRQQKKDLQTIILAAVNAIVNTATASNSNFESLEDQSAMFLYVATHEDAKNNTIGELCQAILSCKNYPLNSMQEKALIELPEKIRGSRQMQEARLIAAAAPVDNMEFAERSEVTTIASAAEDSVPLAKSAAKNVSAARILSTAGTDLFSPSSPRHFVARSPVKPDLPDSLKSDTPTVLPNGVTVN